jgi:hypothetical protein
MEGKDLTTEEAFTGRAAKEGDDFRFNSFRRRQAEPVAQGGAREVVLLSILTLGGRRMEGIGEGSKSSSAVRARVARGILPRGGGGGTLTESHGSGPVVCLVVQPP